MKTPTIFRCFPRTSQKLLMTAATALVLLSSTTQAAEPLLPAAAGTVAMPRTGQTVEASAQEISHSESVSNHAWHKRWVISLVPLAASQVLDAASSYGLRELNPLLASSNGGFEMKAVGIKAGSVGGLVVAEYLLIKKYPRSAKFFAVVNFSTAGVTSSFAAHNFTLR